MFNFILKRVLGILPTILLVSFISFFVIQIQPGSALDSYLEDPRFSRETVESIKVQFGLDKSPLEQYGNWIRGIVTRGDFGFSFLSGRSVTSQIGELIGWTVLVSLVTFIFSWIVAIPLGVLVATRKNSLTDAIASFLGYIGVSTPDFLIALLLMALILNLGGKNVGGLFSNEFIDAPWSWARFADLLNHLWQPILVIGVPHIAALMRQMRSSMLDVLNQDYVRTARAKGLAERIVIYRHAVRNAINPLVSIAGLSLPEIINGTIISSIVLNLPTIGPLLLKALFEKDQYVVMTILLISSLLLMVGNLLADIVLARVDPRIRYE
jgi:peptide/nickel transport system permease protein